MFQKTPSTKTPRAFLLWSLLVFACIFSAHAQDGAIPRLTAQDMANVRQLAEQGDAGMQATLGGLYSGLVPNSGIEKDPAQAAMWARKAADQGDADGQFVLGMLYLNGVGVPQDPQQAGDWLRAAAAQGQEQAQQMLAKARAMKAQYDRKK